jgi:formylglycine-generating enzyme required for sulfatase activity
MKKLFLLTTLLTLLTQIGSTQNSTFDKNAFCKKLEKELVKINDSLYASKFECSILNYRTFLNELKSQSKDVSAFLPDTFAGWDKVRNDVRMVPYYLSHPAYNEYPIFSINREAAMAYCKWLNEVYAGYADKKFQQMTFTLPTVSEWENAALSFKNRIQKKHYYKTINDQLITINYTWQSTNPYKENNRHSKSIDLNLLYYGSWNFLSSKKDFRKANFHDEFYQSQLTAPIKSFLPSNNGMYNVCGNVAEMTLNPDIIKGGSFLNHSFDCAIDINTNLYQIPNREVGFRVFMKVKK